MRRTLLGFLGTLCIVTSVLFAPSARADEPEPIHRYEDDRRPPGSVRPKLLLAGAGMTAAFYAPVLGASYLWDQHPGASQMRVPFAGPWLGFSKTKLCNARPDLERCNNFLIVSGAVLLVFDGIGQAGGGLLMLQSVFVPTGPKRAVRAKSEGAWMDPGITRPTRAPVLSYSRGDFMVAPVPTVGGDSDIGMSLVGHF